MGVAQGDISTDGVKQTTQSTLFTTRLIDFHHNGGNASTWAGGRKGRERL